MNLSRPHLEGHILQQAQENWKDTTFLHHVHENGSTLSWIDGPTTDEMHKRIPEIKQADTGGGIFLLLRGYSPLVWVLTCVDDLENYGGLPPSTVEEVEILLEDRDSFADLKATQERYRRLHTTNLEDPRAYARDARTYARAETVVGLTDFLAAESKGALEEWLRRGGWDLACLLNP